MVRAVEDTRQLIMSSSTHTESWTFTSFPVISVSSSRSLILNSWKISCRRRPSTSLVLSVRKVVLFMLVLFYEIHRFGLTGAAFSNEFDASTTTRSSKRRELEVRRSDSSASRNAIVSESTEIAIKKYDTTGSYVLESLPFEQGRDKVTRDIEHEMTNGSKITGANKIVAYETIIQEKSSIAFSGRDNNGEDKYLDQFSQQKPSSKHGPIELSEENNILMVKTVARVSREIQIIANESIFQSENTSIEPSLTNTTKKLLVRSNGLDKNDKESAKGMEKLAVEETTYKPVVAATQPFEKYDRRHFGPPRLENFKEFSKGTTEEVPRSSSTVLSFGTFPNPHSKASSIFAITSSSTSSPSKISGTSLADTSHTSAGTILDGTPMVGKEEKDKNMAYNYNEEPQKSEVTGTEKFKPDNESHANEDYVGIINRREEGEEDEKGENVLERPASRQSTIAAIGYEPLQSSTSISKLSNNVHKLDLVTTRPHDDQHVEAAATIASGNELVDKLELTILGLFELTEATEPRPDGPSELQAARLAVDRINEMGILPNIRLRLIHNDTRVREHFMCPFFFISTESA